METFGEAYRMPHWWTIERETEAFEIPLRYKILFFNEADAALYALRWK